MNIRPIFFCLLVMAHCLLPGQAQAAEGRPPGMTVALPAPDGFVEIAAADHPGYVASFGAEAACMLNRLNKLFILKEELPAFMADDLSEISASFSYGIFHSGPEAYASLYPFEIDTGYRQRLDVAGAFERFNPLVYAGQFQAIERDFAERGKAAAPAVPLDMAAVARWLEHGDADAPGKALALGLVESHESHIIYGWLQNDLDMANFGLISPAPAAVFFAVIDIEGTPAYAAYAQRIHKTEDVESAFQKMSAYLAANAHKAAWEIDSPLPTLDNSGNVRTHAALLWVGQQKYDAAGDAFERLLLTNGYLAAQLGIAEGSMASDAAMLVLARHLAGRNAEAVAVGERYLPVVQKIFPPEDIRVLHLKTSLAQAYAATGDLDRASSLYDEAMRAARQSPDFPLEDHLDMMCEQGVILGDAKRPADGRELLDEAFALSTEHFPPAKTARYARRLMRLALQEKRQDHLLFYGKLVAGLVFYNTNAEENSLPLDADTVQGTRKFMRLVLKKMDLAADEEAFDRLWGSANKPEDSPWNKARDWMTEAEAPLYARYAEVADALHRAGESGTDQEKAKARADFADWLRAVQKMSD